MVISVPMVETLAACPLTKHERAVGADGLRDLALEIAMELGIARHHAARGDGGAELVDGVLGGLDQLWMTGEAQIVAPGEVQDRLAVDDRLAALQAVGRAEEWVVDAEQPADLLVVLDRLVRRQRRERLGHQRAVELGA